MSTSQPVVVELLGREYTIGVNSEEGDVLAHTAQFVDRRMREIRGQNRLASMERIAVLAALNLAYDLQLLQQQTQADRSEWTTLLDRLDTQLDTILPTSTPSVPPCRR